MDTSTIILIIVTLVLDISATRKLIRSERLSKKVKRNNIILVWVIPIVWAIIILSFSNKPPKKTGKFDRGRYLRSGYDPEYRSTGI